jgi:excisionase family DNA binding protein
MIRVPVPQAAASGASPFPVLLGSADVARILQVHKRTVERMMRSETIPGAFKVGKQWRMFSADFDAFLAQQKRITFVHTRRIRAGVAITRVRQHEAENNNDAVSTHSESGVAS